MSGSAAATRVFRPSHDEAAEQSVIGSLLLAPDSLDDIADIVQPEHFHLPTCRLLYETIADMRRSEIGGIDPVTIAQRLGGRNELANITFLENGSPSQHAAEALIAFMASVPHAAHAKYYAKIVRSHWIKRRAYAIGSDLLAASVNDGVDAEDLVEQFQKDAFALGDCRFLEAKVHIRDILPETLDLITERMNSKTGPGVPTGFVDIDAKLNGLRPAELIILAARPGCGKTSFAANIALAVARGGGGVLFFSLEQSAVELTERYLCLMSGIRGDVLRKGTLDELQRDMVMVTAGDLGRLPLLIDDAPGRSVSQIAAICRRHKAKHNLALVVIDYLQLIEPEDKRVIREQQVAQMARGLKCLAKELNLPLIVLAQLNRAVEARDDKRPRLSDLRESGAIEQDADMVLFISRPEMHAEDDRPGEADVTIAKNRAGSTGTVTLTFRKETMQFFDHAPPSVYGGRFDPSYVSTEW